MATCRGLSEVGGGIGAVATAVGQVTDFIVSGVLAGDPIALAAAAITAVLLVGLFQISRVAGSFLALTGFFILVLCPP